MAFGAEKGRAGVVMVLTFGTGIGYALFLNGQPAPNTELGHLEIRGKEAERRASDRIRRKKALRRRTLSTAPTPHPPCARSRSSASTACENFS
jgi:predicted NBD/HSP70 family sugar kinase